jgi:hypothetical protein
VQSPSTPSTSLSRESFSNPLFLESSPPLCHTQLPENLVISEVDGIKYGKYEKAYHFDFMDWWRQTPVGTAINNGKIDEKLQHPHWDRNNCCRLTVYHRRNLGLLECITLYNL